MTGWRFVEQDCLCLGERLRESCALLPAGSFGVGEKLYHINRGIVKIVKVDGCEVYVDCDTGRHVNVESHRLFWVVEPVPAAPQKLGRLPKLGEKFWVPVEVKCIELDPLSEEPAYVSSLGWLSEAYLGIDNSAKRSELAAALARVVELERELGGGE